MAVERRRQPAGRLYGLLTRLALVDDMDGLCPIGAPQPPLGAAQGYESPSLPSAATTPAVRLSPKAMMRVTPSIGGASTRRTNVQAARCPSESAAVQDTSVAPTANRVPDAGSQPEVTGGWPPLITGGG